MVSHDASVCPNLTGRYEFPHPFLPPLKLNVVSSVDAQGMHHLSMVTEDEDGGLVVELRAERSGVSKSGRLYQLTVTAQDLAGNEVTGTATCTVPHDRGKEQ